MDRVYFDDNETQDMLLLRKLSTDVGMFNTVGECEKYACADASGITKDGRIAIVELKNRYNEIQDFGDIFIESKKVAYLLLEHITKGHIPLYINFFTVDGVTKHAAVWNLLNVLISSIIQELGHIQMDIKRMNIERDSDYCTVMHGYTR